MAYITKPHPIPGRLRDFDLLPDSTQLGQPVLEAFFGCSSETISAMVNAGALPPPKKLSEPIALWYLGELRPFLLR